MINDLAMKSTLLVWSVGSRLLILVSSSELHRPKMAKRRAGMSEKESVCGEAGSEDYCKSNMAQTD
jgi:hypothetical protein